MSERKKIKKPLIIIVCSVSLFISGYTIGGYRGSYRYAQHTNVADLGRASALYGISQKVENKALKNFAVDGVNMQVQFLRERASGDHASALWLNAYSKGDGFLSDEDLDAILQIFAKHPITNVSELTPENLEYLKSIQ